MSKDKPVYTTHIPFYACTHACMHAEDLLVLAGIVAAVEVEETLCWNEYTPKRVPISMTLLCSNFFLPTPPAWVEHVYFLPGYKTGRWLCLVCMSVFLSEHGAKLKAHIPLLICPIYKGFKAEAQSLSKETELRHRYGKKTTHGNYWNTPIHVHKIIDKKFISRKWGSLHTRPKKFQPSSWIALVYQPFCSRTIPDRL